MMRTSAARVANFLLLLSFFSIVVPAVSAVRSGAEGKAMKADVSCHVANSTAEQHGQDALDAFKAVPEVGKLLGNLIDGIQQAGLLDLAAASYDTPEPEPSNPTLTLKTSTGEAIFGEIASKSRVPVAWKVQPTLTFQIQRSPDAGGETRVAVTGLGTHPSKQGLALYEAAMQAANPKIDPAVCKGTDMACIQEEMKAAGAYLLKTTGGWASKKYPNYDAIKDADGKVGKVLKTAFGNTKIYFAVQAKGEWPKIFYSMITAAPLQITSFVFTGGKVYAESEPDPDADAKYTDYHLVAKSNMMGKKSMKDAKTTMALAEGFAKSGMAFAKMLAFGKGEIRSEMEGIGLTAAKPDALGNLFALCEKNLNSGTEGDGSTQDPQCTGKDVGRVWWGTSTGVAFEGIEATTTA